MLHKIKGNLGMLTNKEYKHLYKTLQELGNSISSGIIKHHTNGTITLELNVEFIGRADTTIEYTLRSGIANTQETKEIFQDAFVSNLIDRVFA